MFAQDALVRTNNGKMNGTISTKHQVSNKNGRQINPSVQSIFTEDFASGLPGTWQSVDNTGVGVELWVQTTTGSANGNVVIDPTGTSALNGFMMFDSDGGGQTSGAEDADLITPAINCTGQTSVFVSFNQYFAQYAASTGILYVSNNNTTWTDVYHAETGLGQNQGTPNPDQVIVDISAIAANQATVYLKWNYIGNWDYYWMVDDVDVYAPSAVDGQALSITNAGGEYTITPINQAGNLTFSGEVKNLGTTTITGSSALLEIVNATTSAVVFTENVSVPALASFATLTVSPTGTYAATTAGDYQCRLTYNPTGDANANNNVITSAIFSISDSVYARDDDSDNGSLGIGAGAGQDGIIGQNFQINSTVDLTSVSFFLTDLMNPNPAGSPVYLTIHPQTAGSNPDGTTVLGSTDTLLVTPGLIAAGGQYFTLNLSGGPITLTPGLYYVGAHEVDSLLTLGRSIGIASPGSVWVSWNSIPTPPAVNGWAVAEDFNFTLAYRLRMNLSVFTAINENAGNGSIEVYPNPSTGIVSLRNVDLGNKACTLHVFNALGQDVYSSNILNFNYTTIDLSTQPAGLYFIQLKSGDSVINKSVMISRN